MARSSHNARCGWRPGGVCIGALDREARFAGLLAIVHAGRMTPPPRGSGKHRHGRLTNGNQLRKILGARARRTMRGKDFCTRLFAILRFVRDVELHAARIARRMRNGLTRLRILDPRACAEACAALACIIPHAADSS